MLACFTLLGLGLGSTLDFFEVGAFILTSEDFEPSPPPAASMSKLERFSPAPVSSMSPKNEESLLEDDRFFPALVSSMSTKNEESLLEDECFWPALVSSMSSKNEESLLEEQLSSKLKKLMMEILFLLGRLDAITII